MVLVPNSLSFEYHDALDIYDEFAFIIVCFGMGTIFCFTLRIFCFSKP